MSVKEISLVLGFDSLYHLSRQFKHQVGLAPRHWRQARRRKRWRGPSAPISLMSPIKARRAVGLAKADPICSTPAAPQFTPDRPSRAINHRNQPCVWFRFSASI